MRRIFAVSFALMVGAYVPTAHAEEAYKGEASALASYKQCNNDLGSYIEETMALIERGACKDACAQKRSNSADRTYAKCDAIKSKHMAKMASIEAEQAKKDARAVNAPADVTRGKRSREYSAKGCPGGMANYPGVKGCIPIY